MVQKGRQEICLQHPGEYDFYFMEGCYYYGWFSMGWTTHLPFVSGPCALLYGALWPP